MALCEALEGLEGGVLRSQGGPGARGAGLALKWPNDLWWVAPGVPGRKLGGILIESVPAGAQRLAVVGVGLNVRAFEHSGPPASQAAAPGFDTGFASLAELDPSITPPRALARVAPALVQALLGFERGGFASFVARYNARDMLNGQYVHTHVRAAGGQGEGHDGALEGVARGVTEGGALRVQTQAGWVDVSSGEVSVRLSAGPERAS